MLSVCWGEFLSRDLMHFSCTFSCLVCLVCHVCLVGGAGLSLRPSKAFSATNHSINQSINQSKESLENVSCSGIPSSTKKLHAKEHVGRIFCQIASARGVYIFLHHHLLLAIFLAQLLLMISGRFPGFSSLFRCAKCL